MTVIGIDPGVTGAIAVLSAEGLLIEDTPYCKPSKGKGEYDLQAMAHLLAPYRGFGDVHVVIEKVHAMPGGGQRTMGATSAFNFGMGWGVWLGLIAGIGCPHTLVAPQRWKKAMLADMGSEKDHSRMRAMQLFPAVAKMFSRKKDDGRAEAALMAEYGRRLLAGGVQ